MDTPKYIYIDDENDQSIESLINGFNDTKLIRVERLAIKKRMDFSELKNSIVLKIEKEGFSGLLIDLRLDGEGPDSLDYSAVSISSELRSMSARKEILSFPIVLCSTLDKIKETYKSDKTSHDLFDYTFKKADSPEYEKFSKKLKSLANGYKDLPFNNSTLDTIFGRGDIKNLDQRIFERFYNQDIIVPYDFAHFTVKTLFHCTNPLIKETTMNYVGKNYSSPDLSILLSNNDQKERLGRIKNRGSDSDNNDTFESRPDDFQNAVSFGYQTAVNDLCDYEIEVSGKTRDEVEKLIWSIVEKYLPEYKEA